METTIFTFQLNVPFAQWAALFDSQEMVNMHDANGVTPLYRGVSTDDPSKVVVIHQAAPGVAVKLFNDNKEAIANTGHIIESTQIMSFTA